MAPPNGFGSVYSNFTMSQLSPTIAYNMNDNWSFGFAPNIDQATLAINPGYFAAPTDPDGIFGNGAFRQLQLDMDFPASASIGVAYRGVDKLIVGLDARYIDYKNTAGFEPAGFASAGSVTGFGWDSIFVVTLGAQYQIDECFSVCTGFRVLFSFR